jgi:hypothetical protein
MLRIYEAYCRPDGQRIRLTEAGTTA